MERGHGIPGNPAGALQARLVSILYVNLASSSSRRMQNSHRSPGCGYWHSTNRVVQPFILVARRTHTEGLIKAFSRMRRNSVQGSNDAAQKGKIQASASLKFKRCAGF